MRKLLVVLAAAVVVAVFPTPAAADQPARSDFVASFDNLLPAGVGCSFDIQVYSVMNGRVTVFVDKSGGTRREQYHIVEQDTFTANGKTLLGVPFSFNATWIYDSAGNLIHLYTDGVAEKVRLPDGSLFIAAGRIDFVAHGLPGFILTPDHGATVNLEGFCAALAP
jgi:hypothetical protein